MTPERTSAFIRSGVCVAGAIGLTIGAVWLAAWFGGYAPRWSASGEITMKTNAALAILLASSALLLLGPARADGARRWAGAAASAVVLLIGALTLGEHLFRADLGIDQLLAKEAPGATATVSGNRMGPPASSSFVLIGLGLLALARGRHRALAAHLGLVACSISLVPAVGYLLDVETLYGRMTTGIAWSTVVAMLSLGLGLVLASSDEGPIALLLREDAGGALLRQLLPWALLLPLALVLVRAEAQDAGLFDRSTGRGLLVIAMVVVSSALVWRSAARLSRSAAMQRAAEQALRDSEQQLRALYERNPASVVLSDVATGRIVQANEGFTRMLGFSVEEAVGRTSVELGIFPTPEDHERLMETLRATGSAHNLEITVRTKSGAAVTGLLSSSLIRSGERERLITVLTDITERKQAERARLESEERLRRAQSIAHLGSWELELQTNRLVWCDEVYRILGLEPLEVAPAYETFLEAVHPDDRAAVDAAYRGSVRDGEAGCEIEHRIVRRSTGEIRVVEEKWQNIRDASGAIARSLGMVHDVTERKRAEEELRRSEATLNAFFVSSPGILNIVDDELRIVKTDSTTPTYFGLTRESILGKQVADLSPDFVDRFGAMMRGVIESGVPKLDQEVSIPVPSRAGEVAIWRASYFPVPLPEGRRGLGVMGVEITDVKRAEAAREELLQALRDEDERKSEFLAVLSHELRNPLTPIRNSLYILDRAARGGDQARRAQGVIARQTDQLARLVDDLLEVTRLSRKKVQLQLVRCDLNDLVRRTIEDHRSIFDEAELKLEVDLAPEPVFVSGDWNRLAQVVGNLLHNAAKFTPQGGRVNVSMSTDTTPRRAVLRVADTGEGMAPELLATLFQPFTQAKQGLDRDKGGLGLGLALVKGLVEQHGGEVEARSAGPGKGAELTVMLPLDGVGSEVASLPSTRGGRAPRRVLVIEDNVDAADSLREALALGEDSVEVAYDGTEGLRKARELWPEVVFCDIGLPDIDGYAVARAFRADETLRSSYLVALTGYALPEDVAKALEAGFDRHIAKPPDFDELMRVVDDAPPSRSRTIGSSCRVSGESAEWAQKPVS